MAGGKGAPIRPAGSRHNEVRSVTVAIVETFDAVILSH